MHICMHINLSICVYIYIHNYMYCCVYDLIYMFDIYIYICIYLYHIYIYTENFVFERTWSAIFIKAARSAFIRHPVHMPRTPSCVRRVLCHTQT